MILERHLQLQFLSKLSFISNYHKFMECYYHFHVDDKYSEVHRHVVSLA